MSEAERATKEANDAEKKRGDLEKRVAELEVKITKAQVQSDKESRDAQQKAMDALRRQIERPNPQFAALPRLSAVGFAAGRPVEGESSTEISATNLASRTSAIDRKHDVFLSHASEDKDEIARPLKDALEALGLTVWFDEIKIKVGQSIRREIESGIANCRFGVVVLSPHFLSKQWTQAELDALFARKMESGEDLILPIWHHISKDEVLGASPILAGILALNSSLMTIGEMAETIAGVVRPIET